ncbi:hypothetical protein FACS1894187_12840 [Synergistales bacterium]|nr:hypothetical protein FACS1894187_12840 [Synergistales bacterium]
MKKTIIFTVLIMLLASLAIVAVAAEELPDGQPDTYRRESKNFSDDETIYSRMANYCGRMMSGGYYERPSRDGYGGGYGSCH